MPNCDLVAAVWDAIVAAVATVFNLIGRETPSSKGMLTSMVNALIGVINKCLEVTGYQLNTMTAEEIARLGMSAFGAHSNV